jgi:fructosamine-3-kinase
MEPAAQEALQQAIRGAVGAAFRIERLTPVAGGSIHACYRVDGGTERFFAKVGGADCDALFGAEADGLAALAATDSFRVPARIAGGRFGQHACLVLEFLDLRPLSSRDDGRIAGQALARMHQHTGPAYGWPTDNFLGRTLQVNTQGSNWGAFFANQRIAPMLARATGQGFDTLARPGRALVERIPALLVGHHPPPALLHGDLWHGNIGMLPDGRPAIFDPAVSYGDPEFELAMASLFGGFSDSFFASYRQALPPPRGEDTRAALYRLYHVLNHLVLFGRAYLGEAERGIARLLAIR